MSVAPRRPKGPPLNAMRAFEAAARTESFVAAAQELGVTPGAVSQHVKTIEDWVGRPLFRRNAQGVELTETGRALLPDFTAAFDALGAAAQALRLRRSGPEIHIAALPSVAQLWLPQRLARVRRALPGLRISVTAMEAPPNLARELFDLSLFITPQGHPGIEIAEDRITPVCAPDLAQEAARPGGLNGMVLLHDQTWAGDWATWAGAAGIALDAPTAGPHYSLYALALEEAKAGAGLLMGHLALVEGALADGTLVQPFAATCATGRALILDLPEPGRRTPEIQRVIDALVG
jgi:LysR family glycine cleavage system transcriptional activator